MVIRISPLADAPPFDPPGHRGVGRYDSAHFTAETVRKVINRTQLPASMRYLAGDLMTGSPAQDRIFPSPRQKGEATS